MRSSTRSTLFPYTTLFRSETLNEGRIGIGAQMIGVAGGALRAATEYVKERTQFGKAVADFQAVQDRKSTRLNSSHTVISYAVFCLKKKKKTKHKDQVKPVD